VHLYGGGERAALWIAGQQLLVITTQQLNLAGLTRHAIAGRHSRGTLRQIHRGVHVLGAGTPLPGGYELAACLVCRCPAFVSHVSAAVLWRMIAPKPEPVEVTVTSSSARDRPGITVHRTRSLPPTDVTDIRGIPVTAPARTLLDLAASVDRDELERALSEAFARQLVTERELDSVLTRGQGRAGAVALRALVEAQSGARVTRSDAERRLLGLISHAGLPLPRTNVRVDGYLVDAWWPEHNLIVEIDGFAVHGQRRAFERDRGRDQRLVAAGRRVMRITWRQLTEEPMRVVANLARALERGS
jgi:very-short-patch-repair endonuclease